MKLRSLYHLIICAGAADALVGITNHKMYVPDPCGAACFSYFKDFELDCSTITEGEVSNSAACLSNSSAIMQSIAWCWEIKCSSISNSSNKKFLKVWDTTFPNATISFFDALAMGRPNNTGTPETVPLLNEALLPDDFLFENTYRTNKDFLDSEFNAAKMALSLVTIPWILVFCGMLYNCVDKFHLDERFLPKFIVVWFRKYLFYPALFKEKCAVPISLGEGFPIDYIPPRLVTLAIICYYIINVIYCSYPYTAFWEMQWYPHDTAGLLYTYVGNRTGILSFANIPVLILFASRNNIFQWMTGWSYATFQHLHRHVSYICALEALVHSILYTIKYVKKPNSAHLFAVEAAKPYFAWGIFATVVCCIMPPLAILKLRIKSYELFLFFHYVFAAVFLVGCYYHIYLRFSTKWGYLYWLYCAFAVWGFDIFIRFLRVAYMKFKGCKSQCTVELVDIESRTVKLTYSYRNADQKFIGCYYYLYFTTIFPFFTSHPFTVAEWSKNVNKNSIDHISSSESDFDELTKLETKEHTSAATKYQRTSNSLVFYMQCQKGTTSKIFDRLEANKFEAIKIFSFLEGPYGSLESGVFDDYDFILLLTGGIGNTVVLNYMQSFLSYKSRRCVKDTGNVKLSILHTDRFVGRLDYLKSILDSPEYSAFERDVDYNLHNTSTSGRIDIEEYLKSKVHEIETNYSSGIRRIAVVTCGPAKFNDTCRRVCVEMQEKIHRDTIVSYITDPFEW